MSAHEVMVENNGACPWCGGEDADAECPEPGGNDPVDDLDDDLDEQEVCECELDWRCGLHRGMFTPLELLNDAAASRDGGF